MIDCSTTRLLCMRLGADPSGTTLEPAYCETGRPYLRRISGLAACFRLKHVCGHSGHQTWTGWFTVPPNSRAAKGSTDSPFSSASRANSQGSGWPKLNLRTLTGDDLSWGWWLTGMHPGIRFIPDAEVGINPGVHKVLRHRRSLRTTANQHRQHVAVSERPLHCGPRLALVVLWTQKSPGQLPWSRF
jgi:hypothetical protein